MSQVNLKSSPYFDDFDENKKFYQILYRPSYPVQTRELNSMQSLLQQQIANLGKHQFKNGDKVVDGDCFVDVDVKYVKLAAVSGGSTDVSQNLINYGGTAVGKLSQVTATVLTASGVEGDDPSTLYLKFTSSCPASQTDDANSISAELGQQTFTIGETIVVTDASSDMFTAEYVVAEIGDSSLVTINKGIYFIFNKFILIDRQILILDKYDNIPSFRVGLQIIESIVTPEQDQTLLDNANGSNNYTAPGAHRYAMDGKLVKYTMDDEPDENFIELVRTTAGDLNKITTDSEVSIPVTIDTLARRTYDESGDYVVNAFSSKLSEHRNNDRGAWAASTSYDLGDIVSNAGNLYVCAKSGISSGNTAFAPSHTSGSKAETTDTGSVRWTFTSVPSTNNGRYGTHGYVKEIKIVNQGSGYTSAPNVVFSGGGISSSAFHATAEAFVDNGKVVKIRLLTNGTDSNGKGVYTEDNVVITIDPPTTEDGIQAQATAVTTVGNSNYLALELGAGKAYVRGYEIQTNSSTVVPIEKSRDSESASTSIHQDVGNYVYVTNIDNMPDLFYNGATNATVFMFKTMDKVRRSKNDIPIGSCRIRGLEFSEGEKPNGSSIGHGKYSVYKLFIDNIKFNSPDYTFERDVKSFAFSGNETNYSFSCDVVSDITKNIGVSLVAGAAATTTTATYAAGVPIPFTGSNFTDDLKINDYVNINGYIARVNGLTNDKLTLSISQKPYEETGGSVKVNPGDLVYLVTSQLREPQKSSLIFELPQKNVKSVTAHPTYYTNVFLKSIDEGGCSASGTVTFNLPDGNFDGEYIIENISTTSQSLRFPEIEEYSISTTSATFKFKAGTFVEGATYGLITSVVKTAKKEHLKTKLLKTASYQVLSADIAQESEIYLMSVIDSVSANVYDAFRIDSIKMYNTDWGEAPSAADTYTDITYRYQLNDGQTSSCYNHSSISLKAGYGVPTGPIVIEYRYFYHDGDGDYFTVDSYNSNEIDYDEIPSYGSLRLADCIDFRQTVNSTKYVAVRSNKTMSGIQFEYYIPRCDRVYLTHNGVFGVVRGNPGLNPSYPELPAMSMNLLNLKVGAYTFGPDDVDVSVVDNRRYTMRDIGNLENRIKSLEDFTTLSFLEQATSALDVLDESGTSRYTQGFVVDNFTKKGGTIPERAKYSIDNGVMRPLPVVTQIGLKPLKTDDKADKIQRWPGNIISLPLSKNVELIGQKLASKAENINPFNIVSYVGTVSIIPDVDNWTITTPLDTIKFDTYTEDYFNSLLRQGVETVWGEWANDGRATTTTNYNFEGWEYTTTQNQKRVGTEYTYTAVISTDKDISKDYIVSSTDEEYMRSRYLLVKATGLRPNTKFYPFFGDGRDVSFWCTPSSILEVTPVNKKEFDCTTTATVTGSETATTLAARKISTTVNSYWADANDKGCLNIGDIITSSVSDESVGTRKTCTAVVVGSESVYDNVTGELVKYRLHIVNIRDTSTGTSIPVHGRYYKDGKVVEDSRCYGFSVGDIVTGSISSATAKVISCEPNKHHVYDDIISDSKGDVEFLFWIPDTSSSDYAEIIGADKAPAESAKFTCGTQQMILSDDPQNISQWNTSKAYGTYSASGKVVKTQSEVVSVKTATISTTDRKVEEKQQIITSSFEERESGGDGDPVAQTFYIGKDNGLESGCFLTGVDLFFATKDEKTPVSIDIRTVSNGYPTNIVLPFSEVEVPAKDVKLSTKTVSYIDSSGETVTLPADDTPTRFEFKVPVYVKPDSWYAIVVKSNSNNYNAWISEVGKIAVSTNQTITDQPYNGVYFKSQNASTWNASQLEDLKFTLYRAVFDNSSDGSAKFVNSDFQPEGLTKDAIQTFKDSGFVRIYRNMHGFRTNDKVVISRKDSVHQTFMGTVSCGKESLNVTGSNTTFTQQAAKGNNLVVIISGVEYVLGVIASVSSDGSLTLEENLYKKEVTNAEYKIDDETINGISITDLITQAGFKVSNVSTNYFAINLENIKAKVTGRTTSKRLEISHQCKYDVVTPTFNVETFSNDGKVKYNFKGMDLSQSSVKMDVANNALNYLAKPCVIYNSTNISAVGEKHPMVLSAVISSSNPAITPMIDGNLATVSVASNYIDSLSTPDDRFSAYDFTNDQAIILDSVAAHGVANINITERGSGYTTAPTITFRGGGLDDNSPNHAKATAVIKLFEGKTYGYVNAITIESSGSGYTSAPTITFSAPVPPEGVTGITATAAAVMDSSWKLGGSIDSFEISSRTGYTSTPTITVSGGGLSDGSPLHAVYRAEIGDIGSGTGITKLVEVSPGYGYTTLPTITVSGGGLESASITDITVKSLKYNQIVTQYKGLVDSIQIGKWVELSGFTGETAKNNGRYLVENINKFTDNGKNKVAISLKTGGLIYKDIVNEKVASSGLFIEETSPIDGSYLAKYITKPIRLNDMSNYLRVMFSVRLPEDCSISVYYKAYVDAESAYDTTPWTLMDVTIAPTLTSAVSDVYSDVEYSAGHSKNISFDTYAVKIVMNTTNTCAVPLIKQFRAIACV